MEAAWGVLRETVYHTGMEWLGPTSRLHKGWFGENCAESTKLLEDKRRAYEALLDDPTSTAKNDALRNMRTTIQLNLRQMHDSWL